MIYLESLDGKQYDLSQYGLTPLKPEIDSLSPRHSSETLEGRNGHIDTEMTYEGRTMRVAFVLTATSIVEYTLLRNEIFKLFDGKTYFHLIEKRTPNRRWKVRSTTRFTPEKLAPSVATFEIELQSSSPYAESINKNEYVYNSKFSFSNIGDIFIDMREQNETEIEFKGASTNLTIRNKTTGDEWKYTGSTTANDVILLKGIRATKNGTSIIKNTNKKIITFAPSWNDFEILGSTNFTLKIRTRFYFI